MDTKNYTQVLIDGKVYTLGGSEDESYLQKAASYVNEKNSAMRKVPGFTKQSADYQMVMTELNIADDYFKAVEWGEGMERQKNDMEKETYSLKHELVSTQMKLEAVLKDLEERQREMDRLNRRTAQLEGELKEARENLQNLRNNPSADTENNAVVQAVEEIKETVEVEAGITLNASRTEYVSGSGARESSQPEAVPQTPEADASAQQPDTPAVQTAQKQPAPSLRVLNPASEAGRGMTAASAQAAATACCGTHCGGARRGNDGRGACQKSTAGSQKSRFPQRWKKIRRLRGGCLMGIREASFISGKQFRKGWTKWRRDR